MGKGRPPEWRHGEENEWTLGSHGDADRYAGKDFLRHEGGSPVGWGCILFIAAVIVGLMVFTGACNWIMTGGDSGQPADVVELR